MKKLIFILIFLSFNTYGKCVEGGWFSGGKFCFESLPEDYATFAEIEFTEDGPRVPGWDVGLIKQIDTALEVLGDDNELAKELLIDVYMQLDYVDILEPRSNRTLNAALKALKKAILGFPRKNKIKTQLKITVRKLKDYSEART